MNRSLTFLLTLAAIAAGGCGDDDEDAGDSVTTPPADTQVQTQPAPASASGCRQVSPPEPKPDGGEEEPTDELSGEHAVTFETNCGSFTVAVDEQGGLSAASFVQLAESGFYDDTVFHRIVPGFVIQGGDPTGSGVGGPGYTTEDAPADDATYPKGTVAMAKSPAEPPGTAGSQFFVVTGEGDLTPDYAIVGEVTRGLGVVERIGELGDPSERPTEVVVIEKATVKQG